MEKLTTTIVLYLYNLNNIKEKLYSSHRDRTKKDAYVFHSKDEFYQYFLDNNVTIYNKDLLDLAIFSELRNGDVIALKNVCDYVIDRVNQMKKEDEVYFELFNPKQKIKTN